MSEFFYCLTHHRTESAEQRCSSDDVLGPYATSEEAGSALDRVADRNETWDEEDKRREEE